MLDRNATPVNNPAIDTVANPSAPPGSVSQRAPANAFAATAPSQSAITILVTKRQR